MADEKNHQEHPLANVLVNVLIPVLALSYLSKDPEFQRAIGKTVQPWHIGPTKALMLALAYEIVAAGREDRGFLATHCAGWEHLRAYIMGEADGVAKTAAWAAALTGIGAGTIATLARDLAALPSMITSAWSIQRADWGEQPYWMTVALAAITFGAVATMLIGEKSFSGS